MYRAYYAIPRTLATKAGEQTNAVFGVASMLLAILQKEEPTHLLFCFDAGEETFRHEQMETYKEGRPETPEEFYLQIPRIMELLQSFPLCHVSDLQYEADDFLCTYAKAAEAQGMRVTIVTGDRDALQLASPKTRIAIPHKGYFQAEYLDPSGIEVKYGVRPDQIASYKGLTGDSSDNLPGVRGIGPKGAAKLLQAYGTLEGVYAHLPEVAPSVREKLEHDREQAFFCERMARLICDIPLPISLKELALSEVDLDRALAFFRALEFTVLLKRLTALAESPYGKGRFLLPVGAEELTQKSPGGGSRDQKSQMAMF